MLRRIMPKKSVAKPDVFRNLSTVIAQINLAARKPQLPSIKKVNQENQYEYKRSSFNVKKGSALLSLSLIAATTEFTLSDEELEHYYKEICSELKAVLSDYGFTEQHQKGLILLFAIHGIYLWKMSFENQKAANDYLKLQLIRFTHFYSKKNNNFFNAKDKNKDNILRAAKMMGMCDESNLNSSISTPFDIVVPYGFRGEVQDLIIKSIIEVKIPTNIFAPTDFFYNQHWTQLSIMQESEKKAFIFPKITVKECKIDGQMTHKKAASVIKDHPELSRERVVIFIPSPEDAVWQFPIYRDAISGLKRIELQTGKSKLAASDVFFCVKKRVMENFTETQDVAKTSEVIVQHKNKK